MKRLYDPLLSIPFKYRSQDEFQLRLIHAWRPAWWISRFIQDGALLGLIETPSV